MTSSRRRKKGIAQCRTLAAPPPMMPATMVQRMRVSIQGMPVVMALLLANLMAAESFGGLALGPLRGSAERVSAGARLRPELRDALIPETGGDMSGTVGCVTGDRGWSRLEGRDNALNALRLVFASLVIFGHAYPLGYDQRAPISDIHSYAVDGFFVLSGFLIAGSRERLSMAPYLWRRALRLVPGLVVCLVVCAFVIGPVAALAAGAHWGVGDSRAYLLRNASFRMTPDNVPLKAFQWNVSLWTLPHEASCYLLLGVIFAVIRDRVFAFAVIAVSCAGINLLNPTLVAYFFTPQHAVRLLGFFTAGTLLYLLRKRIPFSGSLAGVCSIVVVGLMMAGRSWYWALGPPFLAYALLWLGASLRVRACRRTDLSYGTYIYGLPVQQALIWAGVPTIVGPVGLFAASMALVLPLAYVSWVLVERPAMRRWSGRRVRRHVDEAAGPVVSVRPQRLSGVPGDV